ncbi:hypothetical protein BaRGS_00030028 [Batillaria attramentaria]|uniref:Uncharacterized protein n=1 Tax=Batillaria attramentaria TaxID=370345 RepID=A0ABD0JVH4_9CAEN
MNKRPAPFKRDILPETITGVQIDGKRHRKQSSEHVRDRYGNKESVGRTPHFLLQENEAEKRVTDDGEHANCRAEITIDGDGELRRVLFTQQQGTRLVLSVARKIRVETSIGSLGLLVI